MCVLLKNLKCDFVFFKNFKCAFEWKCEFLVLKKFLCVIVQPKKLKRWIYIPQKFKISKCDSKKMRMWISNPRKFKTCIWATQKIENVNLSGISDIFKRTFVLLKNQNVNFYPSKI